MPRITIDNVNDARVQPYRNLKFPDRGRWSDRFVVEGEKLVRLLLRSDFKILRRTKVSQKCKRGVGRF